MYTFLETCVRWTEIPAWVAFYGSVLLLLPLSIFKRLRNFTGHAIMSLTLLMGLHLWFLGAAATVSAWGTFWLIVGILMLGVGPLFIGMLALAIHYGAYADAGLLLLSFVVVVGLRFVGAWIATLAPER